MEEELELFENVSEAVFMPTSKLTNQKITLPITSKVFAQSATFENKGKAMTVKEVAEVKGVSESSVKRAIRKLFAEKMQNGKTTFLNEKEVAAISAELKGEYHTSQLTYSAGEQVKNTTTDLEIIGNALSAFNALRDLYERKESEYKQQIANQEKQISELTPLADGYRLTMSADGTYSMAETAKILKLEKGNKTLFAKLRSLEILDKNNIPKQDFVNRSYFSVVTKPIPMGDSIVNKTVTRVTSKGLDFIAKKLGLVAGR